MEYYTQLGIELPSAKRESFFLQGTNDILLFIIPGWSETPMSIQPAAHYLNNLGYSVFVPEYPNYSIHLIWQDWWKAVWTQLYECQKYNVKKVYLAGFSMGGLFSIHAAMLADQLELESGLQIMGNIPISPPFYLQPFFEHLLRNLHRSTFDREIAHAINRIHPTIYFKPSDVPFAAYRGSDPYRPICSVIELYRAISFTNRLVKQTEIKKPTMVLLTQDDEVVNIQRTKRRVQKHVTANVYILPGKHNCLLDHSCKQVCDKIHWFITQTNK